MSKTTITEEETERYIYWKKLKDINNKFNINNYKYILKDIRKKSAKNLSKTLGSLMVVQTFEYVFSIL